MQVDNGQTVCTKRTLTHSLQQTAQEAKPQPLEQLAQNSQDLINN